MQAILNIAIRAARRAGLVLLRKRQRLDANPSAQGMNKLELEVKRVILDVVQKAYHM